MLTLLVVYVTGGLLLIALSIPLIRGRIPPNGLYGFRVPSTLNDPQLWYTVNAYAGKRLLVAGLGIIAAPPALALLPGLSLDAYALLCLAVIGALLAWAVIDSFRYLQTLKRK